MGKNGISDMSQFAFSEELLAEKIKEYRNSDDFGRPVTISIADEFDGVLLAENTAYSCNADEEEDFPRFDKEIENNKLLSVMNSLVNENGTIADLQEHISNEMLFDDEIKDELKKVPNESFVEDFEREVGGEKGIKEIQQRAIGQNIVDNILNGHTPDAVALALEYQVNTENIPFNDDQKRASFTQKVNEKLLEIIEELELNSPKEKTQTKNHKQKAP